MEETATPKSCPLTSIQASHYVHANPHIHDSLNFQKEKHERNAHMKSCSLFPSEHILLYLCTYILVGKHIMLFRAGEAAQ